MTTETNTPTLISQVRAMLPHRSPHISLQGMPNEDAQASLIEASGLFAAITDKTAYLAWVRQYRALIRDIEIKIRDLKTKRRCADDNIRYSAQSSQAFFSAAATALIRMRRLGKTWSREQAQRRLSDAA